MFFVMPAYQTADALWELQPYLAKMPAMPTVVSLQQGIGSADRIASVPTNQLAMQKLMVNQALDNMGLNSTQTLATFFDGIARHSADPGGHEPTRQRARAPAHRSARCP